MIRFAVAALLLLFPVAVSAQEPSPPILRTELQADSAVPGQPVMLRLTVLTPTWFARPPDLPTFDLPNIMVRLPPRSTFPVSERIEGDTWSGISRVYRLYPLIPGVFRIPPQTVRVYYARPGTTEPATAALQTEPLTLSGTVPQSAMGLDPFIAAHGLELEQTIDGDPADLEPGQAVTRTLRISVDGAPPMVIPPLLIAEHAPGLSAYSQEPVLDETAEDGVLSGTRTEQVTYIAESGGRFVLPAVRLDWFDLGAGRVETVEAGEVEISVRGPPPSVVERTTPVQTRLLWGLVLLVLMVLAILAWRWFSPIIEAWLRRRRIAYRGSEEYAFRRAERAIRSQRLGAALGATDGWWLRHTHGTRPFPTSLAAAFQRIGAAVYGGHPPNRSTSEHRWSEAANVLRCLARRERRLNRRSGRADLPPLNPVTPLSSHRDRIRRDGMPRSGVSLCLISLVAGLSLLGLDADGVAAQMPEHPAYVGSPRCAECHEAETAGWRHSHHALAWTEPTDSTVLGDFDDAVFEHYGVTTRFFRRDGGYFVETDGPDGEPTVYAVQGVAGIAPLQQYLVALESGGFQALDTAWDVDRQRWYHLYPAQQLTAGDGLHWTGPYKSWNARCAECHATGFEKNYDSAGRVYRSTQAEIGVGCEACHGPASVHLHWARGHSVPINSGLSEKGFTIDLAAGGDAETEIQQCAGCHSRREPLGADSPVPGTPFHDAYRLALLRPGLYHPDGTILEEVYVYGSFLQSKMYAKGVRCTDCHDPHSADRVAEGNAVCTQCHSPAGNERFPSLRLADYDTADHHFHVVGTPGALCKSCHMIERTYMQIDGRRDHSFRIPRPDLSIRTGAPNACTDCHADRSPGWAAAEIAAHFPDGDRRGPHFSEVLSVARISPIGNGDDLLSIAEDPETAGIIRATALEAARDSTDPQTVSRAAALLSDDDPLVRHAAVNVQRAASPAERLRRVAPLLEDPVRSVRIAAVRALLNAPIARLPASVAPAFNAASAEYRASLAAKSDYPETHMVLGGTALVMRNLQAAEAAFSEAVALDPQLVEAWSFIVRIREALGDRSGAQEALRTALRINPESRQLRDLERNLPP